MRPVPAGRGSTAGPAAGGGSAPPLPAAPRGPGSEGGSADRSSAPTAPWGDRGARFSLLLRRLLREELFLALFIYLNENSGLSSLHHMWEPVLFSPVSPRDLCRFLPGSRRRRKGSDGNRQRLRGARGSGGGRQSARFPPPYSGGAPPQPQQRTVGGEAKFPLISRWESQRALRFPCSLRLSLKTKR